MDKPDKNKLSSNHHSLQRTLLNLFFLLTFLIITIINIGSYYQVLKFSAANQLVIHTYQVAEATNISLVNLLDVESLVRAYLLTNDQFFIKNLDEKINSTYTNLGIAKKLIITDAQKSKIFNLELLFKKRIDAIREITLLKKNHPAQTPKQSVLLYNGQNISEQIKTLLLDFNKKEFNLLKQRDNIALDNLHRLNLFIISASAITLFIIFIGILMLNRQLSRQIRTEKKLRESEALLKGIIDGSNDFIAALDLDYRFIIFNRSYKNEFIRVFGKEVAIGMNIKEVLAHLPEEQQKVGEIWERALKGEEFMVTGEFGDKRLEQTPYEITFGSIRDNYGNLIGASHIVRNIKNRVEAEKALLAANEKLMQAYKELKAHDEGVSLLNQMDTLLQACTTTDEALALIMDYCKKLLPFTAGTIYLTYKPGNYLLAKAQWNAPQNNLQTFSQDQCWALRQGKTYKFLNQEDSVSCKHYAVSEQLQLCFCVPLLAQQENIGLLYIEIKKTYRRLKEQLHQTADSYELIINNLGALIALSISNIRLKNRLRIRSIRDPLTKLYNRGYLNESLEREITRAERNKAKLAIVMLDVDHFKKINDKFGHQTGDLVLQTIGNLLLKQVRKSDIACRYGGEEFFIMLYDVSLDDAIDRAENIRKKMSDIKFDFANETISAITASFGIAMYPEHGENMEKLIRAADKALYESKNTGRNKVTISQINKDTL